jgi:nicotinamide-nucleotide amidase
VIYESTVATGAEHRAKTDRAPRNHRHCRILDRRACLGSLAGGAGRLGLLGGAVVYTKASRAALLGIGDAEMQGLRPATEAYALLLARRMRERNGAVWGFGETGATGPTGNRYGDPAGHTCIAVAGPAERAITLRTGSAERLANMDAFAKRALELLVEVIPAA